MDKIFSENPNLKEYFETTDGHKFFNENAAKNHAKTLAEGSRGVKHVERPADKVEIVETDEEKEARLAKEAELKAKKDAEKAEKAAELKAKKEAEKAEAKAKKEAEVKAKKEAEAKAKEDAAAQNNGQGPTE